MTAQRPALSDLSVTEFVALARLGFVPCGLVAASSFIDARWSFGSGFGTGELCELSNAMRDARKTAVRALINQANELGAEGIVGVGLQVEHHQWHGGHNVARFLAIGTAIGRDPMLTPQAFAGAPSLRVANRPFCSDLSGQDFVALLRAGFRPVALASGNCVYRLSGWSANKLGSVEIEDYTQAYAEARELAMSRLYKDLQNELPVGSPHHPAGIVGMQVSEGAHSGEKNIVEFTAIGTAIAPLEPTDPRRRSGRLDIRMVAGLDN